MKSKKFPKSKAVKVPYASYLALKKQADKHGSRLTWCLEQAITMYLLSIESEAA